MKETARRYNKNKLRYELISNIALRDLAQVYTNGAEKYTIYNKDGSIKEDGANNWRKGLRWTDVIASAKRHIQCWELGEDFDEIGTKHLANAAWNLFTLLDYYETYPQGDDRIHWFKNPLKRVYLDIDGVLANFELHFLSYLNLSLEHPTDWNDYRFRENFDKIANDEKFWLTIPRLIEPIEITYPIKGYCTSRPISNDITHQWLENNGFPQGELINVGFNSSKVEALSNKCDIFVDDSIYNFTECQSNGILCYLMSRPHNLKFNVGHFRINSLKELPLFK